MDYLKNKFLFSLEKNSGDIFQNALIYICEHDKHGAFGFIVNDDRWMKFSNKQHEILSHLNLLKLFGGPVQTDKMFLIHSSKDIKCDNSIFIDHDYGLNSSKNDIMNISHKLSLENSRIFLGYCGWSSGQLESEIQLNTWHSFDLPLSVIFRVSPQELTSKISLELGYNLNKIFRSNEILH
ncbi:MAG: YqgE/AlgH family protein [Pseudomonadota bacterium]|nr:YqgE/AlgH family protein [Pseudomonadota bacterium]